MSKRHVGLRRLGGPAGDLGYEPQRSVSGGSGPPEKVFNSEIPFPGNGDRERQRLGSNAG